MDYNFDPNYENIVCDEKFIDSQYKIFIKTVKNADEYSDLMSRPIGSSDDDYRQ